MLILRSYLQKFYPPVFRCGLSLGYFRCSTGLRTITLNQTTTVYQLQSDPHQADRYLFRCAWQMLACQVTTRFSATVFKALNDLTCLLCNSSHLHATSVAPSILCNSENSISYPGTLSSSLPLPLKTSFPQPKELLSSFWIQSTCLRRLLRSSISHPLF